MKRLFTLFIYSVLSLVVFAQFEEPVHLSVKEKKIGDDKLEVTFQGSIAKGWHMYGTDIPSGGPIATELTLEKCEGLKPEGKLQTKCSAHKIKDDIFDMEVTIIETKACFVQRFRITDKAYSVKGYLTYGACNDENCIPPSTVEFNFHGKGVEKAAENAEPASPAENPKEETTDTTTVATPAPSAADTLSASQQPVSENDLWTPVIDKLQQFNSDDEPAANASLWWIFLLGIGGGLLALVTPCVWPIIPMTVSFFLKRNKDDRRKAITEAVTYGISIVVIYVALGMFVTMFFGASALNALSTNAIFNIFFFLLLLVFGLSFLGGFELTLPSSWSNAVDKKAEKTTGMLSIFLMAFTLCLVSFSCTGPIIGFLLVEVGSTGEILAPITGMLGFAIALALPFSLFAMFPTMMKSAPKSGNWMNCIKVLLGFLELAFSLKFLSVADLSYGWHILDREVFLCLWIVIFALMGAYLFHWIRLPHDEDEYDEMGEIIQNPKTSVTRLSIGAVAFAFALYMVPGLWGAPCKAVGAFAPPMNTQDFNLQQQKVEARFNNYEQGMAYAQNQNMPVMIDFTGFGCVNCRKMEAAVWSDPEIAEIINSKYILITLYVDDKTPLAQSITVNENGQQRTLRTVGDKWSYLQRHKFGANAQPFYVLTNASGDPLTSSYSYDEDVPAYRNWLKSGLGK